MDIDSKDNITKPTYMSSKFWKKNDIVDSLKEVIEPDSVDVTSIRMNEELCPLIWDGEKLKDDVRKALLLNAKRFIEFSDVENLHFKDIMLTGSMANFNYNEDSDLDVHIIMDFSQISENTEFVTDFFKLKKQLWGDTIPVDVKGHDVELYFQDVNESHKSSGTFSLIKNDWIIKPTKKIININTEAIKLKSADLMNAIDDLENNVSEENFLKKYEVLKNKIKKYRQTGLANKGEYSIENLVFKILRNNGYMEKLINMKREYLTNELSLNEFFS